MADLTANISQLDEVIGIHRDADHRLVVLENTPAAELAALPSDSLTLYVRALTINSTFDSRDGTLDALIASGRLGLVRDVRLREVLVQWRARVEDLFRGGA